jgi:hypothetical protein
MPKYTINGVTYNSPRELTDTELEELGGGQVAAPQAAPVQPVQQQTRSVPDQIARQLGLTGRAAYEAFTSPATAVLEAGRTAYNLGAQALGSESRLPSFYAEQAKSLNAVGVPQPENAVERAVNAGVQGLTSTAGLAKVAPTVPALAADLARQIPAGGVAGLVSQPVGEVVKDITGSDLAAFIASAGAGAVGAAGTGKAITAGAPVVDRLATKAYNLGAEKLGSTARKELSYPELLTMDQVKQRASASYQAMDEAGVVLKPNSLVKMFSNINQTLDDARMIPGTDQAKAVQATLDQAKTLITTQGTTFTGLDKMRQMLNDLRMNKDPDIRRLGAKAVAEVDDYIMTLKPNDLIAGQGGLDKAVKSVTEARKDWRNLSRATVLDDALNTAEARALDPKASESELIRRGFINIAADKKKMAMFTTKEQNVIKSVAKGGSLDPLLTFASQFSPLRSKLAAAGGAYAFTQAPITTTAVAGGGLLADAAQSIMRRRAAELGIKQIASGAAPDLVRSLSPTGLLTTGLNPPGTE